MQEPTGLQITAIIIAAAAFLTGLIPFLGLVLGAVGVILAIIAMRRRRLRPMSVTGLVLSALALLTSAVTSLLLILALIASAPPPASQTEGLERSDFAEVEDRDFAQIAKAPDDHTGEHIVVYGQITQLDSATGKCTMRVNVAESRQNEFYEYDENAVVFAGDRVSDCPAMDSLVTDDVVKLWVTVEGSYSYTTMIGGSTTVPAFGLFEVEVIS
ncbi:DUF4190 domain-containing protein [Brevibacterium album]|uniref:DUF4190 domain-containing protein n=1 Tax=Brevibacterium album TaxID=417948 RepID=UPI00041AEAAD|nr:DUF4190 domain-containing protein [Brevibacterium album]